MDTIPPASIDCIESYCCRSTDTPSSSDSFMQAFRKPSQRSLSGRGRVATLGQSSPSHRKASPTDTKSPWHIHFAGMFIIDHFEVHDEGGNPVPADEEAVCVLLFIIQKLTRGKIGGGGIFGMFRF